MEYLARVKDQLSLFSKYEFMQIPRSQNVNANALARLAATCETGLGRTVPVEILPEPSIKVQDVMDVDLIGLLPQGKGQTKFAVVAVDYFTKLAEAEALATITEKKITDFIWKGIICRFEVPYTIISDNGRQFDNATFRNFCMELSIKHICSSPAHPQANEQVESVNKIIKRTLKTRLGLKGLWAEELPSVLCVYRMTPCTSTGETPFHCLLVLKQ
ncbi:uncharacterized protein LOC111004795 [Momordica charantia]|uniref:Uncharacterized protein LOC111004795 n=1 Tax=Momordica charantia TaxID=3673 RepID=A0A6J1BU48_MOMCH|nr:uncharacterized protein LOC111004795 [Momordica charantia]